jgi:glyoxylase-like metal-dependent hydrolase (beta-lactamase superfamily II)
MTSFPSELKTRIVPIRGFMGFCHLLIEEDKKSAVLLDTGLFGELWVIQLALKKHKLALTDIKAILLTHGHLDHSGNLHKLKSLTGAPIYAHPLEQEIINGTFPYQNINKWCGRLENLGRRLLNIGKPIKIDIPLENGTNLPYFDGLEVVHLPGHTLGHCGFHSRKHNLLFCGDLFASYTLFSHLPPPILNTQPNTILNSMQKAWDLECDFILPQHYDLFNPTLHKHRFESVFFKEIAKQKERESKNTSPAPRSVDSLLPPKNKG